MSNLLASYAGGFTRGRRYDELGIQIAGLDYCLHNSVDLLTREQFPDARGDYYKFIIRA